MNRRRFLAGALAAPLVVRQGLLMPVKPVWAEPDSGIKLANEMWWNGPAAYFSGWESDWTGYERERSIFRDVDARQGFSDQQHHAGG